MFIYDGECYLILNTQCKIYYVILRHDAVNINITTVVELLIILYNN